MYNTDELLLLYLLFYQVQIMNRGTLMQIWKFYYMLGFIYNFAFLNLRNLKLFTCEVCIFLKSRVLFNIFCCFCMFVKKYVSKSKQCYNAKPLAYYFYVKTKLLVDFHICIGVPLSYYQFNRNLSTCVFYYWFMLNKSLFTF